jgi:hypothetical protein
MNVQHARPQWYGYLYQKSQSDQIMLACAEADMAIKLTTVKARITFIFIRFSKGAGSAYADVTFEDAWPLQLSGDYYLVYTP